MSVVAGVDGCRGGWVAAVADRRGAVEVAVHRSLDTVLAAFRQGEIAAVAIDMPIGLPSVPPRGCDVAARRLLGPRRSSVFPAPIRAVLGSRSYAEACARSRTACGVALSRQAFNLLPKIDELDRALEPPLQERIVEAHPELAFAHAVGSPMQHPKRRPEGRRERLAALQRAGLTIRTVGSTAAAAPDDLLDAAILTLVAQRVVEGSAERIGDGACDARGLRMEIVI